MTITPMIPTPPPLFISISRSGQLADALVDGALDGADGTLDVLVGHQAARLVGRPA